MKMGERNLEQAYPFAAATQQLVEELLDSVALLAASGQEESEVFESGGYDTLRVFGISDQTFRIDVIERCTCENDEGQMPDGARTTQLTSTLDGSTGRQYIAETVTVAGKFIQIRRTNTGASTETLHRLCAYLLPIGSAGTGAAAGGGGTGSAGGPGNTIATKADLVVPAAVESAVLTALDIPAGTKRVTIQNVGANTVRIKSNGEGGGAGRGLQLLANDTMSIGTSLGSVDELDAFSTLGTTLSFFFERE